MLIKNDLNASLFKSLMFDAFLMKRVEKKTENYGRTNAKQQQTWQSRQPRHKPKASKRSSKPTWWLIVKNIVFEVIWHESERESLDIIESSYFFYCLEYSIFLCGFSVKKVFLPIWIFGSVNRAPPPQKTTIVFNWIFL